MLPSQTHGGVRPSETAMTADRPHVSAADDDAKVRRVPDNGLAAMDDGRTFDEIAKQDKRRR